MLPTRPPKTKPRGRQPEHALTNAFVRNVARAGRYCDGHGLYLDVRPTGSRSWVQRLAIRGRRRELGLGGFPLVSLKEARETAFANRKLARSGGDPLAEKRRASGMPTFAEAAVRVWTDLRPGWSNPRLRIPVKSITHSDAKPISDSDANRSPVGAERRGPGSRLRVVAPG